MTLPVCWKVLRCTEIPIAIYRPGRIEGAVQRLLEAGTGWNWLELAGTICLDSGELKTASRHRAQRVQHLKRRWGPQQNACQKISESTY